MCYIKSKLKKQVALILFEKRNLEKIKDPLRDFKTGLSIKVPSRATVEALTRG